MAANEQVLRSLWGRVLPDFETFDPQATYRRRDDAGDGSPGSAAPDDGRAAEPAAESEAGAGSVSGQDTSDGSVSGQVTSGRSVSGEATSDGSAAGAADDDDAATPAASSSRAGGEARIDPSPIASGESSGSADSAEVSEASEEGAAGARLGGRFTDLGVIDKGGMGVVHLARQRGLAREVAVKRIIPKKNRRGVRAKFLTESFVAASLEHPNIVPVYELDDTEARDPVLAMKYIRGRNWITLLFPEREEDLRFHLGVLLKVCDAVQYAHDEKGILHLDLKPVNIRLGDFGEVYVMDWGLAASFRDASEAEHPDARRARHARSVGSPCGTPVYMPPELAEARGAEIGPPTDVYLLGAILYEVVARRRFRDDKGKFKTIMAAADGEPPPFEESDDVPPELQRIVLRAVAKSPADRFPSIEAFRDAVEGYLTHAESVAISQGAREKLEECRGMAVRVGAGGAGDPATSLSGRARLYTGFAEASAGFGQAKELWAENEDARAGALEARLAFAGVALGLGDLGLAETQLTSLDAADPRVGEMRAKVEQAKADAREERRRARLQATLLKAAGGLIVAGLAAGFFLVDGQRRRAEQAEGEAHAAEKEARDAAEMAGREKEEAQRTSYALYRDNYYRARDDENHDEAAVWLCAAVELAPHCGIDPRLERLSLTAQVARISHFEWTRTPSFPDFDWVVETPDAGGSLLWAGNANTDGLFLGHRTAGSGWRFERILEMTPGGCQGLAWWPGGERILAGLGGQLTFVRPSETSVDAVYPLDAPPAEIRRINGPFVLDADGASAWLVVGDTLERIDLAARRPTVAWRLALPAEARIEELHVDDAAGRAVVLLNDHGDVELMVFDLSSGDPPTVLLRERRRSATALGLASEAGRSIALINRTRLRAKTQWTESELLVLEGIDAETPRVDSRRVQWTADRIVGADRDRIEIAHTDGVLRSWSWDGELVGATRLDELESLTGLFPTSQGTLALGDGRGVLTAKAGVPATLRSPWEPPALDVARWDEEHLAVALGDAIEIRRIADRGLVRRLPLPADSLEVDRGNGCFWVARGLRLSRHDIATFEEVGRTSDDVEVVDGGFHLLPGKRGAAVTTPDGLYRVDWESLRRRERLHPGPIWTLASEGTKALLIASRNATLGRVEAWRYSWSEGALAGPWYAPVETAQLTACHLDGAGASMTWGTRDGRVFTAALTASAPDGGQAPWPLRPRAVTPKAQRIPADGIVGTGAGSFLVTREDGVLERYEPVGDAFAVVDRLEHLFRGSDIAELLRIDVSRYVLRSAGGEYGLLSLKGVSAVRPNPAGGSRAHQSWYRGGVFAFPVGKTVVVEREGLEPLSLTCPKVGVDDMEKVSVDRDAQLVAARSVTGTCYLWDLTAEPGERGREPVEISVLSRVGDLALVGARQLAISSSDRIALVDVGTPRAPRVRFAASFTGVEDSHFALVDGVFVMGAEGSFTVRLIDPESGAVRNVRLPFKLRSLAPGAPGRGEVLAGGLERVAAIDVAKAETTALVVVPKVQARRSDSGYYVRSMAALPGTSVVAIGGQHRIYFGSLEHGSCFFELPIPDYAFRLQVEGRALYWIGHDRFGQVGFPDFTTTAPGLASVCEATGILLEEGKLVRQPVGYELRDAE